MSDEVEKKVRVETEEKTDPAATSISALELLSGAASTGAATAGAAAAGKEISRDFGKLEITDTKNRIGAFHDMLKNSDRIENNLDKPACMFEKEVPLSRTERLMLNGLRDAVRSGSVEKVQDMLQTLAENPKSVDRVLGELNRQLREKDPLNSASWEQGKDNFGNSFVRLRLKHNNDMSKSSGSTEVTIGSDGRHSANFTERWNAPPMQVNPADNMHLFNPNPKWHYLPHYDEPVIRYKK